VREVVALAGSAKHNFCNTIYALSQVKCIMGHSVGRQARHFSRNRLSTTRT
jgi:hypothetical protein